MKKTHWRPTLSQAETQPKCLGSHIPYNHIQSKKYTYVFVGENPICIRKSYRLMMMMKYLLNSRKQHHGEIGDWCKSTWLDSRHLSPIHTLIHSFQHSCLHTYVEQAVIWVVGTHTHTHTHARTHIHTLAHKTRFI